MTTRRGIVAGGNWIVDHLKIIDTWPAQDALANILAESTGNGGSPYNILKDLALLGAEFPLHALGLVGDDSDGRAILADCAAHRIETSQLRTAPGTPTSHTDVMTVQTTGRRTFFHGRGANALLAPEHFDFTGSTAKFFHLGYLLLLDTLDGPDTGGVTRARGVLRRAREAGLLTSIDCVSEDSARIRTVVAPVLPEVDVLFANDFEAGRLTGRDLTGDAAQDPAALIAAAQHLLRLGVGTWAVVHSPQGVAAAGTGAAFWQPAVRVPPADIRGATGAGDALAAGILFGLHEEWPIDQSLRLGVCAAAASLYDPSCSASIPKTEDCLRLGSRLGFHPSFFP